PLYVLPALTLHEAVPGHHLQGALAQELQDVPPFRLNLYPHAFGEGWGLYAEKLGREMGVYVTPYEEFGRLTYEMWRACRLVVDTGLHAKGWSRQQALDYRGMARVLAMAAEASLKLSRTSDAAVFYLRAGRTNLLQGDMAAATPQLKRAEDLARQTSQADVVEEIARLRKAAPRT
ncbi:MAG: DUF885 family protein, partial [Reyranella sp.]|nr:DUF885 family protein [Reyranella sp.]